jgi:hypothetical protein
MPNVHPTGGHERPILAIAIGLAFGLVALPSASTAQVGYQSFEGSSGGFFFGGSPTQFSAPSFVRPTVRHYVTRPYRYHRVAARERDEPSAGSRKHSASSDASSSQTAVCVRLCDGRFFPLPKSTTDQAKIICTAACPHAATSVFRTDRELKDATDADGKTYGALPNAFAYRSRVAPDCSCRGGKPGLATVAVDKDPTLEQSWSRHTASSCFTANRVKINTAPSRQNR